MTDENQVASFQLTIAELVAGPFDITAELSPTDGSFSLDRAALESLIGSPLADGNYTLRLEATDEFGIASLNSFSIFLVIYCS